MRTTTFVALPLALLATVALFGGLYLIVAVVFPALSAGHWQGVARWGGAALLAGMVIYRLFLRLRKRAARRPKKTR